MVSLKRDGGKVFFQLETEFSTHYKAHAHLKENIKITFHVVAQEIISHLVLNQHSVYRLTTLTFIAR